MLTEHKDDVMQNKYYQQVIWWKLFFIAKKLHKSTTLILNPSVCNLPNLFKKNMHVSTQVTACDTKILSITEI